MTPTAEVVNSLPAAVAKVAQKVNPWPEIAREVVIVDQVTFDTAAELLRGIKGLVAEVEETFRPMAEKAHAAHKEVTTQRANQIKPLEEAERIIKQKVSEYLLKQQRIQAEQERAAIAAAEAAAAAELEAQLAQAEANGATAREVEELIATAPPPIVAIPAPAVVTKGRGVGQKRGYVATITNRNAFIAEASRLVMVNGKPTPKNPHLWNLLTIDEAKLRETAKTMGPALKAPGLTVTQAVSITARK